MTAQPKIEPYLSMPYDDILIVRREFAMLCDDVIEALILWILEEATEEKRCASSSATESRLWISISYKAFMARLYGLVSDRKTIMAKTASLQAKGFLIRQSNPDNPYAAPQYAIDRDVLQRALDALPKEAPPCN